MIATRDLDQEWKAQENPNQLDKTLTLLFPIAQTVPQFSAWHVCGSTNSTANSYQQISSKEAYKTVCRIPKNKFQQYVVKTLTVSTSPTVTVQDLINISLSDDCLEQWALHAAAGFPHVLNSIIDYDTPVCSPLPQVP